MSEEHRDATLPAPPADEPAAGQDRLKGTIAMSLSALVLLGAGLAVLQVDASAHESNSARETTRTAVRAMRANVVASTVAGLRPMLEGERDFLAYRRPLDASKPSLAEAAGLPDEGGATAASVRAARESVPQLGIGALLTRLHVEAEKLSLQQRAQATTRITWNDRSTQYTTVIAVLAVALFLVGFSLIATGAIRRSAFGLGLVVGLFVIVWAAWIYHLPIPFTPNTVIEATARGAVATDDGDYRGAIVRFDRALTVDPGFATAYAGRARARLLAANPDYAVTRAVVDAGGRAVAQAIADARKASALDRRDIVSATLLALTSFYAGDDGSAERAAGDALAINAKVPDLWLLRSAVQVARGEESAASASFDRALSLLKGTEPSSRTRLLASSYLSYLAWLERYDVAHAGSARRRTERTVATETAFTLGHELPPGPPGTGTADVSGLRYANGRLMLELRWKNVPAGTALSAIGYERPLPAGAWTQPAELALFATVSGSGSRDISLPLKRTCRPTRVRVDVYLDGARMASRTGPGVRPTC